MTKSEYQELVEFLGGKFQQIGRRFDATDEAIRHNGVLIERNADSIRKLAERLTVFGERLDRRDGGSTGWT